MNSNKHLVLDSLKVGLLEADVIQGSPASPGIWLGRNDGVENTASGAASVILTMSQVTNTRADLFTFAANVLTINKAGWYRFNFIIDAQETVGAIGFATFFLAANGSGQGYVLVAFEDAVGGLIARSAVQSGVVYLAAGTALQLRVQHLLGNDLAVVRKVLQVEAISIL